MAPTATPKRTPRHVLAACVLRRKAPPRRGNRQTGREAGRHRLGLGRRAGQMPTASRQTIPCRRHPHGSALLRVRACQLRQRQRHDRRASFAPRYGGRAGRRARHCRLDAGHAPLRLPRLARSGKGFPAEPNSPAAQRRRHADYRLGAGEYTRRGRPRRVGPREVRDLDLFAKQENGNPRGDLGSSKSSR